MPAIIAINKDRLPNIVPLTASIWERAYVIRVEVNSIQGIPKYTIAIVNVRPFSDVNGEIYELSMLTISFDNINIILNTMHPSIAIKPPTSIALKSFLA